jgi:hypothetical protein
MKTCKRLIVFGSVLSVLTMLSLQALAAQQKAATGRPAIGVPTVHAMGPGQSAPQQLPRLGTGAPGAQAGQRLGPVGRNGSVGLKSAFHHDHPRFDPHHFDRAKWARGRAYSHECHWGRCGYWWSLDGYWYFYDHPFYGAPDAVSEVAFDDGGNAIPVEAESSPSLPISIGIIAPTPLGMAVLPSCFGPVCLRP